MEQLPGTGNSQIELDFDNKYDNMEHPDPNDDWEFHVEDMNDCEIEEESMWFTIWSPECGVYGRARLTRGNGKFKSRNSWTMTLEWD